jgi:3-deoxy-7-phosphoheptulonate synthase
MNANSQLARLRGELDRIDNKLLKLIEARIQLCGEIRSAKQDDAGLLLRPRRQRTLIERLQERSAIAPPDAIRHIWRELMGHCLQQQAQTTFLIVSEPGDETLVRLVRDHFGSAAPLEWTSDLSSALSRALNEQAVVVIPRSIPPLPRSLEAFELLQDEDSEPIAWAVGRVCEEEASAPAVSKRIPPWTPASWRERPACQLPVYDTPAELKEVEQRLAQRAPVVELNDVDALARRLADVANGRAILLQGGDCAETFAGCSRANMGALGDLLGDLAAAIEAGSRSKVARVARAAGQFAKPRTQLTEQIDGQDLPAYRGDAVNRIEANCEARRPDPERLLEAHAWSELGARWLCEHVPDGMEPIYTSHEALLLNYEEALTHYDELSGRWWSGSAHLLWIGDRTRQIDGAHIEYARGIANPVAVKCGAAIDEDGLLRLLDILDPERQPGRVTLISRLGSKLVRERLPWLMRWVAREGLRPVWCVDPMHGNTRVVDGLKTRLVDEIESETVSFFEIAEAERVWPGGVHLELTPDDVTECIGAGVRREHLSRRYTTACDPRLSGAQALALAQLIADQYRKIRATRSAA